MKSLAHAETKVKLTPLRLVGKVNTKKKGLLKQTEKTQTVAEPEGEKKMEPKYQARAGVT